MGPNAVGKTNLSLELSTEFFPELFEIISADSVQIYKYMDIGSGKLAPEQRLGVAHHLIDVYNPDVDVEAGIYCNLAEKATEIIFKNGNIPLFVGGTGLYIDSFFKGLSKIPEIDPEIRNKLQSEFIEMGIEVLYKQLIDIDPISAEKIHINDHQRVMRALQVYRGTGKRFSDFKDLKESKESDFTTYIGLYNDRELLYSTIEKRVDMMLKEGLIDEVAKLSEMGYGPELKSMKSIGYAEIYSYLLNKITKEEAVNKIKYESKRYAKRQLTWFRRNKKIIWFKSNEIKKIVDLINRWIDKCKKI